MPKVVCLVFVLATGLLLSRPAAAQSTVQLPLQFDFLNPGARSLSLGSAFAGLADDATAAFTNPAGLRQLSKREASIELRYRRLTSPFFAGGRVAGVPTGIGEDTVSGPFYGESVSSDFGPSFLSVVIPTKHVSFAAYRHELINIDDSLVYRGAFEEPVFGNPSRESPLTGTRGVKIVSYGGSAGVSLGDRVSIGASVAIYKFDLNSHFTRGTIDDSAIEFPYGPPDFTVVRSTADQTSDDVSAAFNVGGLFTLNSKIKAGVVYRKGPSFDFDINERVLDRTLPPVSGTFQVPDVFAIGASIRAIDPLLVTLEYSRVGYSSLLDDYIKLQTRVLGRFEQLELNDGNEFHVGAEYAFIKSRFLPAFRVGTWFDPEHAVKYLKTPANDPADLRLSATLPGSDDAWHFTAGGGLSFSQRFELNVAMDLADRSKIGTGSFIVRF